MQILGQAYTRLNNPKNYDAAFVIHLDTNGNFLWANSSTNLGGDIYNQVATDSQGDVIATAYFRESFPIGDSTYRALGQDGIVVKFGPSGNVLWSIHLQARLGYVDAYGIKVDSLDNVVVAGTIDSTVNFNPLGPAYYLKAANDTYASFVAKYSPSGLLIWANGINSTSPTFYPTPTISIDQQNNIFFSTAFVGSIIFNGATVLSPPDTYSNICIAKYSSAGVLQFAKSIGGPNGIGFL